MLQFTEPSDGIVIICIACQMETADALYCSDTAVCDHLTCICYRLAPLTVLRIIEYEYFRPAFVAADGLRIISSCGRIVILRSALGTHRKFLHRCSLAVIRKCVQYREPGAAACAVDERVKISSVIPVEELCKAFITDRDIRRYEDLA